MVRVRSRVGGLEFEHFDESIEQDRNDGPKARTDPVDPCTNLAGDTKVIFNFFFTVVVVELAKHNVGTKRASRIEGTTGEHDSAEFSDK